MKTHIRARKLCACKFCAPLRELRRRLMAQKNHPHYAARGNEQPLLQQLLADDPPAGGLEAFIADLKGKQK